MPSWTSKGPISLLGGIVSGPSNLKDVVLSVMVQEHPNPYSRVSLLSKEAAAILDAKEGDTIFLTLADGCDGVLPAIISPSLQPHVPALALTVAQQHNFHLKQGTSVDIKRFVSQEDGNEKQQQQQQKHSLVDVELLVSVLGPPGPSVGVDAAHLARRFLFELIGLWVANNEAFLFPLDHQNCTEGGSLLERLEINGAESNKDLQLVVRVVECNILDETSRLDAVGYHCFRGIITPETTLYMTTQSLSGHKSSPQNTSTSLEETAGQVLQTSAADLTAGKRQIQLSNPMPRPPPGRSAHNVDVYTNDGEWFPVHRRLLRPCIALTKAVRAENTNSERDSEGKMPATATPTAHVDIDTATFDRVLIFLEGEALGRPPPSFGIHLVPGLLGAANKLSLNSLRHYCEQRLGDSAARRRRHAFEDVKNRNAAGERLLVMDGMVFDVTRWLPEHPGGDAIIPAQALDLDCSRFFEVYHASRESFLYLREFYIGEIVASDLSAVPRPSEEPSEEFLRQLREYMVGDRLEGAVSDQEKAQLYKSF